MELAGPLFLLLSTPGIFVDFLPYELFFIDLSNDLSIELSIELLPIKLLLSTFIGYGFAIPLQMAIAFVRLPIVQGSSAKKKLVPQLFSSSISERSVVVRLTNYQKPIEVKPAMVTPQLPFSSQENFCVVHTSDQKGPKVVVDVLLPVFSRVTNTDLTIEDVEFISYVKGHDDLVTWNNSTLRFSVLLFTCFIMANCIFHIQAKSSR
ncbi:hypothetical protein CHUAL_013676 [Chamberlinius hualienensis]